MCECDQIESDTSAQATEMMVIHSNRTYATCTANLLEMVSIRLNR